MGSEMCIRDRYWSAQILLIGAEFTWVYANRFGSRRGEGVPIRKGQQEARVDYSSGR